jgi:hypothetical protein
MGTGQRQGLGAFHGDARRRSAPFKRGPKKVQGVRKIIDLVYLVAAIVTSVE